MKALLLASLLLAGCQVPQFGRTIKFVSGFYEGCQGIVKGLDWNDCAIIDRLECSHVTRPINGELRLCAGFTKDWEYVE